MRTRNGGFTIVELVAVIVLLSILGAVAMSRIASPSSFLPAIVSQAVLSETAFAQQLATSRQDARVSLALDRVGDDWRFRIATDLDGVVRTERVDAGDTSLEASSGSASAVLGGPSALTLDFDHHGNLDQLLVGGTAGDPGAGVDISVAGDSVRHLCVYPSGYVNDDVCG